MLLVRKKAERRGGRSAFLLEPVFTRNICGFSSIILLQTRQKYAGGLSPDKYFSRSMQQNLPKRHVYTLVKTGSYITTDERFPFVPGASVSFPDTLPRQHGS